MTEGRWAQQMPIDNNRIRQIEDELNKSTTTGRSDEDRKPEIEQPEKEPEQ